MLRRLGQEFGQRTPIVPVPTGKETIIFPLWKPRVIENDHATGGLRFNFKFGNRVDSLVPARRAPRLHDPLVGDQLDVSPAY